MVLRTKKIGLFTVLVVCAGMLSAGHMEAWGNESWTSHILLESCDPVVQIRATLLANSIEKAFPDRIVPPYVRELLEDWVAFSPPSRVQATVEQGQITLKIAWEDAGSAVDVVLEVIWPWGQTTQLTVTQARLERSMTEPFERRLYLPAQKSFRASRYNGNALIHMILIDTPFHPFSQSYARRYASAPSQLPFDTTTGESAYDVDSESDLRKMLRALSGSLNWAIAPGAVTTRMRNSIFAAGRIMDRLAMVTAGKKAVYIFLQDLMNHHFTTGGIPSAPFLRRVWAYHRDPAIWSAIQEAAVDLGIPMALLERDVRAAEAIDWSAHPRYAWEDLPGGQAVSIPTGVDDEALFEDETLEVARTSALVTRWFELNPTGFPRAQSGTTRLGSPQEVLAYLNFYLKSCLGKPFVGLEGNMVVGWENPAPSDTFQRRIATFFLFRLSPRARSILVANHFISEADVRALHGAFVYSDPSFARGPFLMFADALPTRTLSPRERRAAGMNRTQAPTPPVPIPVEPSAVTNSVPASVASVPASTAIATVVRPAEFVMPSLPVPSRSVLDSTLNGATALESGVIPTLQWIARTRSRLSRMGSVDAPELRQISSDLTRLMSHQWHAHREQYAAVTPLLALVGSAFTKAELRRLGFSPNSSQAIFDPLHWPEIRFGSAADLGTRPDRAAHYEDLMLTSYEALGQLLSRRDQREATAASEIHVHCLRWMMGLTVSDQEFRTSGAWIVGTWLREMPHELRDRIFAPGGSVGGIRDGAVPVARSSVRPPAAVQRDLELESYEIRDALEENIFRRSRGNRTFTIDPAAPSATGRPEGEPAPLNNVESILREALEVDSDIDVSATHPARFRVSLENYFYTFEVTGVASAARALQSSVIRSIRLVAIEYDVSGAPAEPSPVVALSSDQTTGANQSSQEPDLPQSIPGAPYRVRYSRQVLAIYGPQSQRRLPPVVRSALRLLGRDLCRSGVEQNAWDQYSPLWNNPARHHAHLRMQGIGSFHWVAIWREVSSNDGVRTILVEKVMLRRHASWEMDRRQAPHSTLPVRSPD